MGAGNLVPRFSSRGRKNVWCTFLLNYLQERGGGKKEGEKNKNKASYFSIKIIINFRLYLLYVASSINTE